MSGPDNVRILYLCCSQFSGSTLTSFLLGNHSRIATIGHTTGWRYSDEEEFRCSCGERIVDCELFVKVKAAFEGAGIPFDPRDFGTEFRLSQNQRINQILLEHLPLVHRNAIDAARDSFVDAIPAWNRTLRRQAHANQVLMQTVLSHFGGDIYLDNSHSPYRLKRLHSSPSFELVAVHLVRDPRGVTRSLMRNSGLTLDDAVGAWLSHQESIERVAGKVCEPLLLRYEDLCLDPSRELGRIHEFCGLQSEEFAGSFKDGEHHILGNRMRLSAGDIRLDERWREELSSDEVAVINDRLERFAASNANGRLAGLVRRYLDDS